MYNVFDHYRSLHYLSRVSLKDTTTSDPLVCKEHSGDFEILEIERVSRVGADTWMYSIYGVVLGLKNIPN